MLSNPDGNDGIGSYKVLSDVNLNQQTINFFNDISDSYSTNSNNELVGGQKEKCKEYLKKDKNVDRSKQQEGFALEEDLNVVLKNVNRYDCPIYLNPQTASFSDVAIHGQLR
jgi:hypothetical protein